MHKFIIIIDLRTNFFTIIFPGVFNSIFQVLRVPAFTMMLLACICSVLGYSAAFSFGPKYMEKQYNIPAWKANIILGKFKLSK